MRVVISDEAAEFIISKGGQIIVFQGSLTGCCIGKVPSPMLEIGRPRRPLDNYDIQNPDSGITVYLDKDLISYNGNGEITLSKNLWWKSLFLIIKEIRIRTNRGIKWLNEFPIQRLILCP